MNKQDAEIARLETEGYQFSNLIATNPDAENQDDSPQTALMVKKDGHGSQYREVSPDGAIN